MKIIGLTGSIAMGKSAMASMFRDEGIPVHDADQAVHDLMSAGGMAAGPVGETFPQAVREDGSIDRPTLGRLVFNDGQLRQQLEQILHPLNVTNGLPIIKNNTSLLWRLTFLFYLKQAARKTVILRLWLLHHPIYNAAERWRARK